MKKITHVDCFSGAGGICTGFRAAGIETVLAIEKVKSCVETYKANHKNIPVIHNDIRNVLENDVKNHYYKKVDLVTSGMPCETFSTAGSKSRSFYDHRQNLYSEAIRVAKIVNAKLILFENVPAILSKKTQKNGDEFIVKKLCDELASNGYRYYVDTILNSGDFGIPQLRERFFILATNDKNLKLKVPVATRGNFVPVKDAFIDLPRIEANSKNNISTYIKKDSEYSQLMKNKKFWRMNDEESTQLTYHIAPNHREGTLRRFALIKQGEGLKDLFDKFNVQEIKNLQAERILPGKWYIQRNRRLVANAPSVTVTSHCLDELIHPYLDRALTVREVARLQSFPDSYDFKGGPFICPHMYETQDKYEQIGDAVPPLLAYAWGTVIKEILE